MKTQLDLKKGGARLIEFEIGNPLTNWMSVCIDVIKSLSKQEPQVPFGVCFLLFLLPYAFIMIIDLILLSKLFFFDQSPVLFHPILTEKSASVVLLIFIFLP